MHSRRSVGSNIWGLDWSYMEKYYVKLIGNTFINVKSHQISQRMLQVIQMGKISCTDKESRISYRKNLLQREQSDQCQCIKKVDADNTAYENVNFDIKGKKLKLQINNKKGKI